MTYERVSHNKVTTSLIVHILSVTISAQGLRFQRFQRRVSCSRCVLRDDRNSRSKISTHGSAAVGYAGPMPWRTCRDAKLHCDAACPSACAVRAGSEFAGSKLPFDQGAATGPWRLEVHCPVQASCMTSSVIAEPGQAALPRPSFASRWPVDTPTWVGWFIRRTWPRVRSPKASA